MYANFAPHQGFGDLGRRAIFSGSLGAQTIVKVTVEQAHSFGDLSSPAKNTK